MADQPTRKSRPLTRLRVLRTERLTPQMIRVVAGGEGLASFAGNDYTDSYVKLLFRQPGVRYPEPFDMDTVRAQYPREQWPSTRTYTVRHHDQSAGELALDFVYHGDHGLAGPWAAAAQPGDELLLLGPGGAYAPNPNADWHLLVGDEAALPAIAAALEVIPEDVPARAFIQVADASEEQMLATKAAARITWLHRHDGDELVSAVRAMDFGEGRVHAFVHGEAGFVRELRRHLLNERGVPKDWLSISGYWRRGSTDEQWRAEKAAEKAAENGDQTGS